MKIFLLSYFKYVITNELKNYKEDACVAFNFYCEYTRSGSIDYKFNYRFELASFFREFPIFKQIRPCWICSQYFRSVEYPKCRNYSTASEV